MLIVEDLSKSFNKKLNLFPNKNSNKSIVLKDISFKVNDGDRLAILGHNGSGKTTLLKILFGSITPDCGKISWKGQSFLPSNGLKGVSSLFNNNDRSFFWRLSVNENLKYFNSLNLEFEADHSSTNFIDDLSIKELTDIPFMNLSSGQKKKVSLFRGLLKNPKILFFDEFTDSLDLRNQIQIKNLVKNKLAKELNKTIIWVTHSLDEVREICNKVLILENGSIKFFNDNFKGGEKELAQIENMLLKNE